MDRPSVKTSMLAVLYIGAFIAGFNENIINVALVDITAEFGIDAIDGQWLVTGYMIVTAIVIALTAFLFERISMRRLFFAACACFIVGEAVCLVAASYPLLLAARLVQAVGSGLYIPIMMNTVLACVPQSRVGTFLAIGSAAITVGPAFAPVVSGAAATLFGWRAIFVVPGALAIVIVLCAVPLLHDFRKPADARLDVPSVVLAALGLTLLVYGLGQLVVNLPVALVATAAAVVSLGLFVRRQSRLDEPLLDMRPFSMSLFRTACILALIAMMTTFSMSVLLPLYFENVFGETALVAGLFILPPIVVNAVISVFAGRLLDRVGEWPLLPIGFGFIVVGQAATALLSTTPSLVGVIASSVLVYAGVGLAISPSQSSGLRVLPGPQKPSGVSIVNVLLMVAGSLGPSLFVGILSGSASASQATGSSVQMAQAAGFSHAVLVATAIAAVGFVVSFVHARRARATGS